MPCPAGCCLAPSGFALQDDSGAEVVRLGSSDALMLSLTADSPMPAAITPDWTLAPVDAPVLSATGLSLGTWKHQAGEQQSG